MFSLVVFIFDPVNMSEYNYLFSVVGQTSFYVHYAFGNNILYVNVLNLVS